MSVIEALAVPAIVLGILTCMVAVQPPDALGKAMFATMWGIFLVTAIVLLATNV